MEICRMKTGQMEKTNNFDRKNVWKLSAHCQKSAEGDLHEASTFPTTAQSPRVGRMQFAGVLGRQKWQNAMASSEYLWQFAKEIRSSKAALTFCNLFYFKIFQYYFYMKKYVLFLKSSQIL